MLEEKENEMIDRSSSSDIDEFYEDDFVDDNDEIDEPPVDVRQYVISLKQAGIHGLIVSRAKNLGIEVSRPCIPL